ncbi:MAG: M20/M25/M40 family metallo-hydrolase [Alistipes onderdonkii]
MAAALAVMIDPAVQHGPVEALFTVDEETGLTGAFELGEEMLTGKYSHQPRLGGRGRDLHRLCRRHRHHRHVPVYDGRGAEELPLLPRRRFRPAGRALGRRHRQGTRQFQQDRRTPLVGRHAVVRTEAELFQRRQPAQCDPARGVRHLRRPDTVQVRVRQTLRPFAADLKAEFRFREPNFKITLNEMPEVDQVLDARTQFGLVYSLVGVPNGVIAMSFAMPGLVETSTNLASVKFEGDDRIVVTSSQRSSVESAKTYVMQMVESVFALAGADVAHSDGYPGWAPNPQSVLLEKTVGAYERLFGTEPKVRAIHAGLECGLFLEKYPELEMVSFGPTLRGVHSPDERLEIATVPKFWDLLLEVLKTV